MRRAVAIAVAIAAALAAALLFAWAVLRARRPVPQPTGWTEPEDGVPPVDVYLVTLSRDDPRVGTFSRN